MYHQYNKQQQQYDHQSPRCRRRHRRRFHRVHPGQIIHFCHLKISTVTLYFVYILK